MMVDIFEIGIERLKKEQAETEAINSEPKQSDFKRVLDVLICGSPKSGKSTFINRFLDRTQSADPTFGLCYRFATRTRVNNKELANLWELGNGGLMFHLVQNCLNEKNISVSVIVFLNLTEPQSFESVLRPLIDVIKKQIEAAKVKVANTNTFAVANNAPDGCFAVGIPMAIVGSHYDQFQNFDTEKKRNIIRLLRFLAHINGAALLMYSVHQEPLIARGKALLQQFGFDAPPNKTASIDIHKPVFVSAFTDSLDEIGPLIEGRSKPVMASHHEAMELFYSALNEISKQETDNQRSALNNDEESKQFAEPLLDTAIEERYRELEFMIRENRNRSQPN